MDTITVTSVTPIRFATTRGDIFWVNSEGLKIPASLRQQAISAGLTVVDEVDTKPNKSKKVSENLV